MRTYINYEQVRNAFLEGDITRQEFEVAAKDLNGITEGLAALRVELKYVPWWQRIVRKYWQDEI